MTYDLGWWGNDPQNPYQGEHSLPEYVEDAVHAWTDPPGTPVPADRDWAYGPFWGNSVPAEKLGVGLPFYAHTVTSPDATYTFSDLVAGGTTSDGNYYTYAGRSSWLPGPDLVEQRVQFAHDQGLDHIIIWEIGQDMHPDYTHPTDPNKRSLLRAAYDANQALLAVTGDYDGDRDVDASDFAEWQKTFGSQSDLDADGNENLVVDAADYVIWRKYLPSGGAGAIASSSAPVPEPHTCLLCALALLLCNTRRVTLRD
jgi:hypothetical protein